MSAMTVSLWCATGNTISLGTLPLFPYRTSIRIRRSSDTYAYDVLGRSIAQTGADGTQLTTEYLGVWVTTTDTNNNSVARQVDDLDRVVFITDRDAALVGKIPGPKGTSFTYLPFGVLGMATDILGNVVSRTADRLGRVLAVVDPDLGKRAYSYNVFNEIVQETKGTIQTLFFQYDLVGRLLWLQDAIDGDVKYTWDTAANGIGQVAEIDAPASGVSITFSYDPVGRPNAKMWTITSDSYTIARSFDNVGRLLSVTYPSVARRAPFVVTYEYGKFGQVLSASGTASARPFWS